MSDMNGCETTPSGERTFDHLGGVRGPTGPIAHPMSEEEVITFERCIGARLPDDYRRFVQAFGACSFGGSSADNPYIVFEPLSKLPSHVTSSGLALFEVFFGADNQTGRTAGLLSRYLFYLRRVPGSMIPIGDDGGAGLICLGIRGADRGAVFYWDRHEEPMDEETYYEDYGVPMPAEAKRQNVYLIATSFEDFLNRLRLRQ